MKQKREGASATSPSAPQPARQDRQDRLGNARVAELLKEKGGEQQLDDLIDLTPSQQNWIRRLRDLELLNPDATVEDLSMALSLRVWSAGQMWSEDGKSQYPGLILDYVGGDGHRKVRFDDGRKGGKRIDDKGLADWATDKQGRHTNVNHAFPAIAAQAGRSKLGAEYASFMSTSGGDTMQNIAETLLNGNVKQWNSGEYAGNARGEEVADQHRERKGQGPSKLSDLMLEQLRKENNTK